MPPTQPPKPRKPQVPIRGPRHSSSGGLPVQTPHRSSTVARPVGVQPSASPSVRSTPTTAIRSTPAIGRSITRPIPSTPVVPSTPQSVHRSSFSGFKRPAERPVEPIESSQPAERAERPERGESSAMGASARSNNATPSSSPEVRPSEIRPRTTGGKEYRPGMGKGGKGLGKIGAKRHRKILRDNIQGITRPAIRRLARRGGVKRITASMYEEVRGVLKTHLEQILSRAVAYCEHARRKTVTVTDVVHALRQLGTPIYGFDSDTYNPEKKKAARLIIARRR
ncbi:hypothetical protein ABW20_dc0109435 [Dactylellina cionopaga]|nr:hypothetical protein ABW20_dc0109435 [Dactylellina cionopaga]